MNATTAKAMLSLADLYAEQNSGCAKVKVGSLIVQDGQIVAMGANRTFPDLCTTRGCLRVEKYGDNTKTHRNPEDCRALHSELDAICNCPVSLTGATIYVTRYPCEACARAICSAGIKTVYYGRKQKVSEETIHIFEDSGVDYFMVDWNAEDTTV